MPLTAALLGTFRGAKQLIDTYQPGERHSSKCLSPQRGARQLIDAYQVHGTAESAMHRSALRGTFSPAHNVWPRLPASL